MIGSSALVVENCVCIVFSLEVSRNPKGLMLYWGRVLSVGVLDGSASVEGKLSVTSIGTHGKFTSIFCAVSEEARAEMDHTIT